MSLNPFDDVQTQREKDAEGVPIVTIFGAGVAGLTVAHELVERGFAVQVVESRSDPDEEYMCRIGGLAANRFARIPADLSQVHPYFFPEDPDGEDTVDEDAERWVDLTVIGTGTVTVTVEGISVPNIAVDVNTSPAGAPLQNALEAPLAAASPDPISVSLPSKFVARLHIPADRRDPLRVSVDDPTLVSVEEVGTLRPLRQVEMHPVQHRYEIPQRFYFRRHMPNGWRSHTDAHGFSNATKLPVVWEQIRAAYEDYGQELVDQANKVGVDLGKDLTPRMRIREELLVEICGFTDDTDDGGDSRTLSETWATLVKDGLLAQDQAATASDRIPNLERRLVVVPLGSTDPVGRQLRQSGRDRCNRVEVRIVEHVIPGEHGYRFFPAFYRNLFDTMKRTPILDTMGRETGDTAFDQLVATHVIDVALAGGREPQEVKLRWPRSFEELRKLLRLHLEKQHADLGLQLTERDLLRFFLRLAKFLTTSKERREKVYEEESWWKFLGGEVLNGYSQAMRRLLQKAPQALVAMDADETDARSQGLVFCQLLLDAISPPEGTNYTLNGPTTEAWLHHWKDYLRRQGVRFFVGRIAKITETDQGCVPVVTIPWDQGDPLHVTVLEGVPHDGVPTPYTLWVNGIVVRIVAMPGWGVSQVRDRLVDELQASGLSIRVHVLGGDPTVNRLIRNDPGGILIESGPAAVHIHPVAAVRSLAVREDLVPPRSGSLWVRILEGRLGVVGSFAEYSDTELITDSVDESPPPGGGPDFYVLAVDYPEASRIVWDAPTDVGGCFEQLRNFDVATGYRSAAGTLQKPDRDASGRPSPRRFPLRDLSGIQYYFSHQVRIGRGHDYFPDAPWGLSSISQLAYWKDRTARHPAFLGQLSVDIGDWYESTPSKKEPAAAGDPSAWRSSKQEIAEGTYQQVLAGMEKNLADELVRPDWYHLDPGIRFAGLEGLCFGRRALLKILERPPGSSYELEVDGTPISVTRNGTLSNLANDLAEAIRIQTGHLATAISGPRVLIAPLVRRCEPNPDDVRITVLEAEQGAVYRIAHAGQVAGVTANPGDTEENICKDLVDAVNGTLPGVIAEQLGASRSLRLRGAPGLVVSALGSGSANPTRPLLALDPAGEVCVRILPGGAPPVQSGLAILNRAEASVLANDTPFLINGPKVWKKRPGRYDPSISLDGAAKAYAEKGGIYVHPSCKRWFMAGVQMTTHTRLTTMESANESARHVVTAILYTLLDQEPADPPIFNSPGKLLGDPPEIFDPEEYELKDADPLKRLDARLLNEDLPHFIDILRLPELVDAAPPDLASVVPSADQLGSLLSDALTQLQTDWEFTSADEVLAYLRDTLARFLS